MLLLHWCLYPLFQPFFLHLFILVLTGHASGRQVPLYRPHTALPSDHCIEPRPHTAGGTARSTRTPYILESRSGLASSAAREFGSNKSDPFPRDPNHARRHRHHHQNDVNNNTNSSLDSHRSQGQAVPDRDIFRFAPSLEGHQRPVTTSGARLGHSRFFAMNPNPSNGYVHYFVSIFSCSQICCFSSWLARY